MGARIELSQSSSKDYLLSDAPRIAPKILISTDFGPDSERAFHHALAFAVARQARLTILHTGSESRDEVQWEQFPSVRKTLGVWGLLPPDAPRTAVAETLNLDVNKIAVRDDDPRQGITEHLRKNPTDLLIMATQGRTGLVRLRQSSVAETVTFQTNSHALLLPDNNPGFVDPQNGNAELQRVLLALAPGRDPRSAIAYLQPWLPAFGGDQADINVLHDGGGHNLVLPQNGRWQLIRRENDSIDAVIDAAETFKPGLVVISGEGRQGLTARLKGSQTDRLLRELKTPLLSLPSH